jgi:hypothetical protein
MEHFFELMTNFVAVGKAGRGPYIACNKKLFVLGYNAA